MRLRDHVVRLASGAPHGSRPAAAVLMLVVAVASLTSGLGEAPGVLMWQRDALASGEFWRLLSGHAVHLNAQHLLMNLVGLGLLTELLCERLEAAGFVSLLLASALGAGLLLWLLEPQLRWYAGLSGVLHGLWAGAASLNWLRDRRWIDLLALSALAVKLAGASPLDVGIPVVVEAHWYGALSGLLWLALRLALRLALQRAYQQRAIFD